MSMHIGHVALQVEDLTASVAHARQTLGLTTTAESATGALLTANAKHHELQLSVGARAGLDHIGLEVDSEAELERLRSRLIAVGAPIYSESPQEAGIGAIAMRFGAPSGVVFEAYTAMQRAPLGLGNLLGPVVRKLGHVTLFSEEKPALEQFILETLGFRVSDRWGAFATWMRCDADHHGIAVGLTRGATRLHHYAFELAGWGAVFSYADLVARSGRQFLWGPGRHGPGLNIFTYLPDPAGAIVEAYTDLQQITNDASYEPIDWSAEPRAMNLWGPDMPDGWDDLGIPVIAPALTQASS